MNDKMIDAKQTLKTLCNPVDNYEGYSVFEVDFNSTKIKMMTLKDVQEIVHVAEKVFPKRQVNELQKMYEEGLLSDHGKDKLIEKLLKEAKTSSKVRKR